MAHVVVLGGGFGGWPPRPSCGRRVAYVEGDFYAEPKPEVTLSDADAENFARKQAYESERLTSWFGDLR